MLYRSHMHPRLGRNSEALDPLDWLARLSDYIPDPGKYCVHFFGAYAWRSRGAGRAGEELPTQGRLPNPSAKDGERLLDEARPAAQGARADQWAQGW